MNTITNKSVDSRELAGAFLCCITEGALLLALSHAAGMAKLAELSALIIAKNGELGAWAPWLAEQVADIIEFDAAHRPMVVSA